MEPESTKTHDQLAAEARQAMNTYVEPLLQFFAFAHLPERLQEISKPFADLACDLLKLPRNAERTIAIRKLIEARDSAVRADIFKAPTL